MSADEAQRVRPGHRFWIALRQNAGGGTHKFRAVGEVRFEAHSMQRHYPFRSSGRIVTSHEAKAAMHSTPCTSPRASARPPNVGANCVTRPASSTMAKA